MRGAVAAAMMAVAAPAAAQTVDLALVLAVDVSNSMSAVEQELQRQGYVAAFRHPDLVAAVRTGGLGRIAVAYLEWAGPGQERLVVPWTLVDGAAAAEALAGALEAAPLGHGNGTSISSALAGAATLLAAGGPGWAMRRVVDLSGDGPNNAGAPLGPVRARLEAAGITVNGLPIHIARGGADAFESYPPGELERYYMNCVTAGPDAFVIGVEGIGGLAEAIRRKLVREIAGLPAATVPATLRLAGAMPAAGYDCSGPGERVGR
jgi:hypothetical protein